MREALTTDTAWQEWKNLCALNPCSANTQTSLRTFASLRFNTILSRYSHERILPPENSWHLFETHLTVTQTRQGKCYKDWLFARLAHSADSPIDVLQGGASLIMRDVVREYIRNECTSPHTISLDKALADSESTITLLDLLVSDMETENTVCIREYERIAAGHAEAITLTQREAIALLAKHMGLTMSHPAVIKAAGCGKTTLHDTYINLVRRVAELMKNTYPDDDAESQMTISLLILQKIQKNIYIEKKAENPLPATFRFIEEHNEIAQTEIKASIH